jgi:hypothetical protein
LIAADLLSLVLDGSFTVLCGLIVTYYAFRKQLKGSAFYNCWAIGFFLYGFEIFLRAAGVLAIIPEIMLFVAFLFFVAGIWSLLRAKQLLIILGAALFFLATSALLFVFKLITFDLLASIGFTVIFLFVGVAILQHRLIFGRSAERLAIGWILLYFSNLLLTGTGWIIDVFAILAKFIILLGILDYDFIVIADKVREKRFLPPPHAGGSIEGGLKLLVSTDESSANMREGNWLRKKIAENVKADSETLVFVFQDVFPHKDLRAIKWINPEKVSIYLFSSSAEKVKSEFTVLSMGLAQVGAALLQATKQCKQSENGCTVVFFHLSLLIHLFGAEAVYNMLLNKMGYLRENGITLYAAFCPSMHSDQSVVSLFTRLADEIVKL